MAGGFLVADHHARKTPAGAPQHRHRGQPPLGGLEVDDCDREASLPRGDRLLHIGEAHHLPVARHQRERHQERGVFGQRKDTHATTA
jgi:hypothetical protein